MAKKYLAAKELVITEGYEGEIYWQDKVRLTQTTESDFLRESAWVVLSSGMRETVIRRKFLAISAAFHFWHSADRISMNSDACRTQALGFFRHRGKIEAIVTIAEKISRYGFKDFRKQLETQGVEFLRSLPFIGPATSYHLAKNLGLDVVKPDRHLLRLAAATGYPTPHKLCQDISEEVGERLAVVDLVLWRFATLKRDYVSFFVCS